MSDGQVEIDGKVFAKRLTKLYNRYYVTIPFHPPTLTVVLFSPSIAPKLARTGRRQQWLE